jgi:hypothetical protein
MEGFSILSVYSLAYKLAVNFFSSVYHFLSQ